MYFCMLFMDIYWNSECTPVRKDVIICEGNFNYTKISKPFALIYFLFGGWKPYPK